MESPRVTKFACTIFWLILCLQSCVLIAGVCGKGNLRLQPRRHLISNPIHSMVSNSGKIHRFILNRELLFPTAGGAIPLLNIAQKQQQNPQVIILKILTHSKNSTLQAPNDSDEQKLLKNPTAQESPTVQRNPDSPNNPNAPKDSSAPNNSYESSHSNTHSNLSTPNDSNSPNSSKPSSGNSPQQNSTRRDDEKVVSTAAPGRPVLCYTEPVVGKCLAAFKRYYYNTTLDQCSCFLYGGCPDDEASPGQESQSFYNVRQCVQHCKPGHTDTPPACRVKTLTTFFLDEY